MKRLFLKACAIIAGILVLTSLYKLAFMVGADMLIRYDFKGLENMFVDTFL